MSRFSWTFSLADSDRRARGKTIRSRILEHIKMTGQINHAVPLVTLGGRSDMNSAFEIKRENTGGARPAARTLARYQQLSL